jgi:hypothetical protein
MVGSASSRLFPALLLVLALVAPGCPTRPTWPYEVERGRAIADQTDGEAAAQRLRLAVSEAERDSARPWGLPISLYYLADVYLRYPRLGKTAQASELLEESRERWERLAGPADPTVALVLLRLSDAKRAEGESEAADRLAEHADEIVTKSLPAHHPIRRLRESGVPLAEAMQADEVFAETVAKLGGEPL